MTLTDAARFFTETAGSLACMSVCCGTERCTETAMSGTVDRLGTPVREDSLFDLASLTKMFTAFLCLRLRETGLMDFGRKVTDYAPRFRCLGETTVEDVFFFRRSLTTPVRVDACADRASGLKALEEVRAGENGTRAYSDMHAMVLKYALEGAAGMAYMPLLRREILEPLGMRDTCCAVPQAERRRCVCYEREHRIENGRYILREGPERGMPHDPKARLLNPRGDDCCGHAGLFSTVADLARLCGAVLGGRVLSRESLRYMAENHTGHPLPGGGYTQYLGGQCYVRHPVQYHSEIPAYMSDAAIGWSGFTGNHLAIDPEQGIYEFYLGNRVLNRLTFLTPEEGRTLADYGLAPDGRGHVLWEDGEKIASSVSYVHLKDAHYHPAVEEALFGRSGAPGAKT